MCVESRHVKLFHLDTFDRQDSSKSKHILPLSISNTQLGDAFFALHPFRCVTHRQTRTFYLSFWNECVRSPHELWITSSLALASRRHIDSEVILTMMGRHLRFVRFPSIDRGENEAENRLRQIKLLYENYENNALISLLFIVSIEHFAKVLEMAERRASIVSHI